jgi:hypothetical protein
MELETAMTPSYDDIRPVLAMTKQTELSGKGASDDAIQRAEAELGIRFPVSYKMFLKEHGWGHFGSLGLIVGLGSDIPAGWEPGIDVVKVTTQEREGPLSLPNHLLPFYTNGAGDWYAMDCSRLKDGEAPVVLISHEKVALGEDAQEDVSGAFSSWIAERLRQ